MKTLFITALTAFVSLSTFATTSNVKFVASDYSAETQVCLDAAQNGLSSAKNKANDLGIDYQGFEYITKCNGTSLARFSKLSKEAPQVPETKTSYKFITVNETEESQICAAAATKGFSFANQNYSNIRDIKCNGRNIVSFARRYKS